MYMYSWVFIWHANTTKIKYLHIHVYTMWYVYPLNDLVIYHKERTLIGYMYTYGNYNCTLHVYVHEDVWSILYMYMYIYMYCYVVSVNEGRLCLLIKGFWSVVWFVYLWFHYKQYLLFKSINLFLFRPFSLSVCLSLIKYTQYTCTCTAFIYNRSF